jgi:hypothetical protein
MPRLNKTFIDNVEAPKAAPGKQAQTFYRDSALPGFGLRVTNTDQGQSKTHHCREVWRTNPRESARQSH